MDRAAALVAASQGWTPECQSQIEVLAIQLKLEPAVWQECLDELRRAPTIDTGLNRYEQAFADFLHRKMERMSGRILAPAHEQMLLDHGTDKFQLSPLRAVQLLDDYCQLHDIRRLSRTDSELSFRSVVEAMIENGPESDRQLEDQLVEAGKSWGVDATTVRRFIGDCRRSKQLQRSRRTARRVALAILVILVSAAGWVGYRFFDQLVAGPTLVNESSEAKKSELATWWPRVELESLLAELSGEQDFLRIVRKLPSLPERERLLAYTDLLDDSSQSRLSKPKWKVISVIIRADQGLYREWMTSLGEELEKAARVIPAGGVAMRRSLAIAEFVEYHREELAQSGLPDTNDKWASTDSPRVSASQLLRQWWRMVGDTGSRAAAIQLDALREISGGRISPQTISGLQRTAIRSLVENSGADWKAIAEEVSAAVDQSGDEAFFEWFHLANGSSDASFRKFLGGKLLDRFPGDNPADSASTELRLKQVANARILDRYPAIGLADSKASASFVSAEHAVREHVSDPATIAIVAGAVNDLLVLLALSGNPELRLPTTGNHPERFAETNGMEKREEAVATASDVRTLNRCFDSMDGYLQAGGWKNGSNDRAVLDDLLRVAPRIDDPEPKQASILARYYLSRLDPEVWLQAEKALPGFRFWPRFLLALGDAFPDSEVSLDQAMTIVQLVGDGSFTIGKPDAWKLECREAVRQIALQLLVRRSAGEQNRLEQKWRVAESSLADIYRQRRQILFRAGWVENGGRDFRGRAVEEAGELIRSMGVTAAGVSNPNRLPGTVEMGKLVPEGRLTDRQFNSLGDTVRAAAASARQIESLFNAVDGSPGSEPASLGDQLLSIELGLLVSLEKTRRNRIQNLYELWK